MTVEFKIWSSTLLLLGLVVRNVAAQDPFLSFEPDCTGGAPTIQWHAVPFIDQTDLPTLTSREAGKYTIIYNLWFHNTRYHAIWEKSLPDKTPSLGKNSRLVDIPVKKASKFYSNLEAHWLDGVTIFIDFPYPAFPNNIGHWAELMIPVYCTLAASNWQKSANGAPIKTIIFSNLIRSHVQDIEWLWHMWGTVFSPLNATQPPVLLFWDDICSVSRENWLGLEHVLVVDDRFTVPGTSAGFWTPELGQTFRESAFAISNLQAPQEPQRTITFMNSVAGELVVNQIELLEHLQDVANALQLRVRPYTATQEAPFASFLMAMGKAGVLIARHGPLLSNAIFLPPGSVVIELLPYNWDNEGGSILYKNLTQSVGDIHHFAWRAKKAETAVYETEADALYRDWTAEECNTGECLSAHAKAGMLADCAAIQELLYEVLPGALQGASVSELQQPWPTTQ